MTATLNIFIYYHTPAKINKIPNVKLKKNIAENNYHIEGKMTMEDGGINLGAAPATSYVSNDLPNHSGPLPRSGGVVVDNPMPHRLPEGENAAPLERRISQSESVAFCPSFMTFLHSYSMLVITADNCVVPKCQPISTIHQMQKDWLQEPWRVMRL